MKIIIKNYQDSDVVAIRKIFTLYQQDLKQQEKGLDLNLCFNQFEEELATLPANYALPQGTILLAWGNNHIIGCVAVRPIIKDQNNLEQLVKSAEIKRLFVMPDYRKFGIGKQLFNQALSFCNKQYKIVYVETIDSMVVSRLMYEKIGFTPCQSYYLNPQKGVRFHRLLLN